MKLNKAVLFKFRILFWPTLALLLLVFIFWPKIEPDYDEPISRQLSDNSEYALQVWQDKELRLLLPPPK